MGSDLRTIKITAIKENPVALRTVDTEDPQYLSLRTSVGRVGVQLPITVREKTGPEGSFFEIIDGLHRYTSAVENGLTEIPVSVQTADDAAALELQVMGNLCKVDTKPASYSEQLKRMLQFNPTMTIAELADRVAQSPAWVTKRLTLTRLHPEIAKAVDDGKINVSNAYALAKLPKDEQVNYVDSACTMDTSEFAPVVDERLKELRAAARGGKAPGPVEFVAVAHIRKLKEIKDEIENPKLAKSLVAQLNAQTPKEGFAAGLRWAVSLDPDSVAVQKAKFDERASKQAEEKKKAAEARAAKKEKEAAEIRGAVTAGV